MNICSHFVKKQKGGEVMSNKSKHQKFLEEIRAPLRPKETKCTRPPSLSDRRDNTELEDELRRELEKKFDELFGTLSDDN